MTMNYKDAELTGQGNNGLQERSRYSNKERERSTWLKNQVLGNHLILERIAATLSVPELAIFRLVCRSWYLSTLEQWFNQATITLHGWLCDHIDENYRSHPYWTFPEDSDRPGPPTLDMAHLSEFLRHGRELFDLKKEHHFRKYRIFYGEPILHPTPTPKYFQFWNQFGSSMTSLALENCVMYQSGLEAILHHFTPNLESIEICNVEAFGGINRKLEFGIRRLKLSGFCWGDCKTLIEHCPKLVELERHSFYDETFVRVYGDAVRSRCPHINRQLHYYEFEERNVIPELRWRFPPNGDHLLGSSNLQNLQSVEINLAKDLGEQVLATSLKDHSSTLKRLVVSRYPFVNVAPYENLLSFKREGVTFDKLTYLELKGNATNNFDFLRWMPSLETLVIDRVCFGGVPFVPYDKRGHAAHYKNNNVLACTYFYMIRTGFKDPSQYYRPCEWTPLHESQLRRNLDKAFQLQSLGHLQVDYQFDLESLSVLAEWMPNLKTLVTILGNEGLRLVCQKRPSLSRLKLLLGSDVDDDGITGVTNEQKCLGNIDQSNGASWESEVRLRCAPNLTDLKYLQTFELETFCGRAKLTDRAAIMGFLEMPLLDTLIICTTKLSKPVVFKLGAKIRNVQLINTTYSGETNHSECNQNWSSLCKRTDFVLKTMNFQ